MVDPGKFDWVHIFISPAKEALTWSYWHAAREAFRECRQGARREMAVAMKYSPRNWALLVMYTGTPGQLSDSDLASVLGTDLARKAEARVIVAHGKAQIEQAVRSLYSSAGVASLTSWSPKDGELPYGLPGFEPPPELDPQGWEATLKEGEKVAPPAFAAPEVPKENPAVAFSQFANTLSCVHCGKLNVAPEWPRNGDMVPFYYQKQNETQTRPGAHRVQVHCPHCGNDWFVVWDSNPG